jgi:hypothetical protein
MRDSEQYKIFKQFGEDIELLKVTPRQREFLKASIRALLKIQLEREFGCRIDI